MPSKTLTATIKFNTTSAQRSLDSLIKKLDKINSTLNNVGNNKVEQQLGRSDSKLNNINSKVKGWANAQRQVTANTSATNNMLSSIGSKLKTIAATYLGIMGAKAVVNTSDIITSAENRLNNLSGATPESTAEAMDKMYAAAQRSRSAYDGMLSNVSKTMTLAGDAFQNNIDNAIRFQEIMAKAYTVGGASAQEQASSMYQMVQALGSGILQGDELRSVREGAPIAYKAIEQFCQGVLDTDESLKELASQGLVTSDMVVAAIMDAEKQITDSFENTEMTFAQAMTSIKNMAIQAFKPVLQALNDGLNKFADAGGLDAIGQAFVVLANTIIWLWNSVLSPFFSWFANNWYWIQWVVAAVVAILVIHLGILAAKAIWTGLTSLWAFLMMHNGLFMVILIIGVAIGAIVWLANTVGSAAEFMVYALLIVAAAILLIGLVTGSTTLLIIAIVIAAIALILAVFMMFGQQIMGGIYVVGAFFKNVALAIANDFIGAFYWIIAAAINVFNGIRNLGIGLWNAMKAVGQNIGIALENGWIAATNAFWSFIETVLNGVSCLEPAINAIAKAFGLEGVSFSSMAASAAGKQRGYKSYVDVGAAFSEGAGTFDMHSLTNAWDTGSSTFDTFKDGWASDAYSNGSQVGANWQNGLNSFFGNIQDSISGFGVGDLFGGLGDALGVDLGNFTGAGGDGLLNPHDPAYGVGGYDPAGANDDIANALDKIGDNTGSSAGSAGDIADSMELAEEDLEYLRKLAETEWKKEFTTANITVDMSNYNTINGDSDLDGIVDKLTSKLYDELNVVANGVYAY